MPPIIVFVVFSFCVCVCMCVAFGNYSIQLASNNILDVMYTESDFAKSECIGMAARKTGPGRGTERAPQHGKAVKRQKAYHIRNCIMKRSKSHFN